jgi:cytochrome c oxidase cbb3-type subunit III
MKNLAKVIAMKNKLGKIPFSLFLVWIFFSYRNISAQASSTTPDLAAGYNVLTNTYYDILAIFMIIIIIAVISGFLWFGMGEGKPEKKKDASMFFYSLKQFVTRVTPVDKEHEILLPDDFDGIRELDNRIPPWFNWLFYGSIIFAAIYMLNYHVFSNNKLQADEYIEEMKFASMQREELIKKGVFINEETVTLLTDNESMVIGKEIFKGNCVTCHGPGGGGLIGPNLTDNYWINGGGIKNIFKTIKYGVPAKGMITWQTQLNPKQIQQVASYIISIHGTNPLNSKPPQGEKYSGQDTIKASKI